MPSTTPFKLTYATMFNPPEELHERFETALAEIKAGMGQEYGMIIGGKERKAKETFEDHSPIDTDWMLGVFQRGDGQDAADAVEAARRAFPAWSARPWQERIELLRKAADLIDTAHIQDQRGCFPWKWARTAWKPWGMWLRLLT